MKFSKYVLSLATLGLFGYAGHGQTRTTDSTTVQLQEVTVNALGIAQQYQTYAGNVSIITKQDLATTDPTNIQESINRIPGVYMHSGALNTNRITIRGIGSRSPFSTNKIRAYFGEIPLTNGSGETNIEDIDLAGLRSYEVIKGPNSSVFGNGLGGVILMNPADPEAGKTRLTNDLSVGSFGLVKEQFNFSAGTKNLKILLSAGHLASQGYRDNNEVDRSHALLHLESGKGNSKIRLLTYFVDQKAFIPSSLNETDFEETPTKAAFTWNAAQGFEDYITLLQGASFSTILNRIITLKSSVFVRHQDNYEPRPFNILNEKTTGWGTRNRLILDFSSKTTWMLGTEIFWDQHTFGTLENLYRDFPGMGSVEGELLSDFKEKRSYVNLFSQIDHELAKGLLLTAGLNFNKTQYQLEDRFNDADDQSGNYDFGGVISPRIALNYQFDSKLNAYFSFSHGFSPPTLEETLLPDGQINTVISPETGINSEIGIRGFFEKARFDLTFFRMQVSDLLVSRRTADDQFIGINAGATTHQGVEFTYFLSFIKTKMLDFSTQGSYSYQNFVFDEFIDGDEDFSGNQLTGVPQQTAFNRLDIKYNRLFYVYLDQQYTSEIPVTDSNSLYSDPYFIINATLGHTNEIGKWRYDIGLTGRNITNHKYASMLLINASGFGGAAPRYFYPGLPFNWFTRVRVTYSF